MRINSPTIPAQMAKTPERPKAEPRFGYYISPPPSHNTTSNANTTSPDSTLAPRDVSVLMWAILLSLPSLAFGAYKFSTWYAKRSYDRRMNQRHEQLLAHAEAVHLPEGEETFRLEQLRRPQNAVLRNR